MVTDMEQTVTLKTCAEKLGVNLRRLQEYSQRGGFPIDAAGRVTVTDVHGWLIDEKLIADPLADQKQQESAQAPQASNLKQITVDLPFGDLPEGVFASKQVHLHLKGEEKITLLQISMALNARNDRLEDGKHVDSSSAAIRWLLQQARKAMLTAAH